MQDEYGVFVGLDVGKEGHHAVALAPDGKRLHDATLPNTEAGAEEMYQRVRFWVHANGVMSATTPGQNSAVLTIAN